MSRARSKSDAPEPGDGIFAHTAVTRFDDKSLGIFESQKAVAADPEAALEEKRAKRRTQRPRHDF